MDPFLELYQSNLIPNYCKKEDSEKYFERILKNQPRSAYTELDGIKISRLGFGSYRINRGNSIFASALRQSLLGGVNLIDTSSNYGDGSSEALIGDILKKLIQKKELKREEVFVVTKIGYIQGKNLQLVQEKEKFGDGFSEITYYDPNCFHCISPDFLEDQLERARNRLGLFTIDGLLLHNPEYFLMDREHHNVSENKAKSEYYSRIEKAFVFLEKKRQLGIIRYYGISSNTFPKEESAYTFTSLKKVIEIAEEIRKKMELETSGFRIIQFPANLYETGFIGEKNNEGKSIIEIAKEKKIFTLVNRPLNAMKKKGGMDRLAIYRGKDLGSVENELLIYKRNLEKIQDEAFKSLGIENEDFTFVSILDTYKDKFVNVDHFHQALNYSIIPQLKKLLGRVERLDVRKEFYTAYLNLLNEGIEKLEQFIESKASVKMSPLLEKLQNSDSSLSEKTLSQAAVLCILSFHGVNSVLVGMRKENYVQDMLPILNSELPIFKEEEFNSFEI
ncbi:MAG: aldo/keto reductase [Leptospiraceae bacterium]|nr:aldo/keto reductase [Leptospiraceae bacterium]